MKQLLIVLFISLGLFACKKKSVETKTYKLSEDICFACSNHSYKFIGEDTVYICSIITPNADNYNDLFKIKFIDIVISPLPNDLTIFDRNGNQIIHFDDYQNSWPPYLPSQHGQNVESLPNGLYKFIFKKGTNQIEGYFIILRAKDEYIDKPLKDQPCIDCMIFDIADPFLNSL